MITAKPARRRYPDARRTQCGHRTITLARDHQIGWIRSATGGRGAVLM